MRLNTVRLPGLGEYSTAWLQSHPAEAQRLLTQAHGGTVLCLCRRPHPKLYIARRGSTHYLARFPDTGPEHAPRCASYTPRAQYCGRSAYAEGAVTERTDGRLSVRLGASLRVPELGARPSGAASEPASPRVPCARASPGSLSLLGLLHLLWDTAGFNRWVPHMRGRRHYRQLHKYLLDAADRVLVQRRPLGARLWIPEPFDPLRRREIDARRAAALSRLSRTSNGRARRVLVAAQLKSLTPRVCDAGDEARPGVGGASLRLAHTPPRFDVRCRRDLAVRVWRSLGPVRRSWPQIDAAYRVWLMLTMEPREGGAWAAADLEALLTERHFLPVRSGADRRLTEHLVASNRCFFKPLPYDDAPDRYPTALLTDAGGEPVPLEISALADPHTLTRARVAQCRAESRLCWHWDRTVTPDLPTRSIPRAWRRSARGASADAPSEAPAET